MKLIAYIRKLRDNAGNIILPETRLNAVYDEATGERADQLFRKQVYIFPEEPKKPWHLGNMDDTEDITEKIIEAVLSYNLDFIFHTMDPVLSQTNNNKITLYDFNQNDRGIYTIRFLAAHNSTDLPETIKIYLIRLNSNNNPIEIDVMFDSKIQYLARDIVLLNLVVDFRTNTGTFYMASGVTSGAGVTPDPENPDNSSLTIGRAKLTWNERTESLDVEILPKQEMEVS